VEALAIYQTVIDQVREYGRGYDGLTILLDLADICFGLMTELEQTGAARQPFL
jgi:hypothetical protein